MNNYAVIRVGGKQFRVEKGESLLIPLTSEKKINPEVLLTVKDGKVSVGNPLVGSAKVTLEVVEERALGKKVRVSKYKSKSRYRKTTGFRPKYTKVLVKAIA